MANLALALDEIIQQDKKKGVGGSGRGGVIRRARMDALETGPKTSARTRFPQRGFVSGEVPAGRWKHDKFFETYGGGNARKGAISARKQLGLMGRRSSGTLGGKSSGGIAARLARKAVGGGQSGMVKLQLSNLPESVVTSDLEELFQEYNCYGVTVHYDETGAHLGTGDLFTDQQSANQILREFKDIAVDGQEIRFCIVSESGRAAAAGIIAREGRGTPSIRDRLRRIGSGSNPIGKKRTLVVKKRISGGGRVGAARAGAAGRRARMSTTGKGAVSATATGKVKTAEELDMELDAYMQKK